MPEISIIMPSYNGREFIAEAIQSVIEQTYTDWELLIFDDGSTDDTESVVRPFLEDKRIRYEKQENLGQPKTRNKGVRMARGRLIALLDSDDVWLPEKLARQAAIFERFPEVGVCATGMTIIDPKSQVTANPVWKTFHGRALPALVTEELKVGMSTSVTRRVVFDDIGYFDEGYLPFSMDFDFWLRVALKYDFYLIGENLTRYRVGQSSISSRGGERRRQLIIKVVIPRFMNEYGGRHHVRWSDVRTLRGNMCKARADRSPSWLAALGWYLRALANKPFRGEYWKGMIGRLFPGLVRRVKRNKKS